MAHKKTHCKAGHELTAENRIEHKRGDKVVTECRACAAQRKRDKRAKDSPKRRFVQNVQNDASLPMIGKVTATPSESANSFSGFVDSVIEPGGCAPPVIAGAGTMGGEVVAIEAGAINMLRGLPSAEDLDAVAAEQEAVANTAAIAETHGGAPAPGLLSDEAGPGFPISFPTMEQFGIGGVPRSAPPVAAAAQQQPPRAQPTNGCGHGFALAAMCPQCRAAR